MLLIIYPANVASYIFFPEWSLVIAGISSCTVHITVIIEAGRIWLISYDLQYLHSSKNQKWKTQIDVSYADKDWYLQNRGKWGNRLYVARLAIVYYLVTSTTGLTWELFNHSLLDPLSISVLLMPFVLPIFLLFYLYINTPRKLQDQFLFQYG